MSSTQSADNGQLSNQNDSGTLDFKPRPSRLLARFLIGTHALTAMVMLLWVPGRAAVAGLLTLIAVSFIFNFRRHVLHRGRHAARRIVCHEDGRWLIQDQLGEMRPARLLPSSYLHPQLVILNFALAQRPRRRHLVLCPDSLDTQTLRQLRVRLRVMAQGEPDAGFHQA